MTSQLLAPHFAVVASSRLQVSPVLATKSALVALSPHQTVARFPDSRLHRDWMYISSGRQGRRLSGIVKCEQEAEPAEAPPKPTLSKGQVVRVEREKYVTSVEALAVDHPPYFKGLDYIYEARGEVLDVRFYPTGEYALIAWAGIPTAPAWLPASMLVKEKALAYKRT